MRRIKLIMEYVGTDFCGFQIQPNKRTVQGEVERILSGNKRENNRKVQKTKTQNCSILKTMWCF